MPLLDVKERNFIKYFSKHFIIPITIIGLCLSRITPYFEKGGKGTIGLAQIGALVIFYLLFNIIRILFQTLTHQPKHPRSYGKWAIITGSTSGIGKAYCIELASRGMNILQISRNESKLVNVQTELYQIAKSNGHDNVTMDYLVYDFANTTTNQTIQNEFVSTLDKKLKDYSQNDGGVGILINSVGIANEIPSLLHQTPPEEITQMMMINNHGTLLMIQSILPYMIQHQSGAIITISSGSCTHPMPMLSLYSATKAFGHQLTRSLYYEYKQYGIDCLSITPYYFVSQMFPRKKATFMAPFPDKIAKTSLSLLGRQAEAYSYWAHALGGWVARWTWSDPAERLLFAMEQSRERALKKKERMKMDRKDQ